MILVIIWSAKCFTSLRRFAVYAGKKESEIVSGMELLKFLNGKREKTLKCLWCSFSEILHVELDQSRETVRLKRSMVFRLKLLRKAVDLV